MLETDYVKRKHEEDAKKVDIIKNAGIVIASTAGAVSIVHNGAGNGQITPNEAFGIGVAVAVGVGTGAVFHKSLTLATSYLGISGRKCGNSLFALGPHERVLGDYFPSAPLLFPSQPVPTEVRKAIMALQNYNKNYPPFKP